MLNKMILSVFMFVLSGYCLTAAAEEFPSKPITLHMSFAETGSSSLVAQVYAPKLEAYLGQPVKLQYHPGGMGGNKGAEAAASSPADGYHVLIGTVGNIALLPHLTEAYKIDPVTDMVPVTQIASVPNLLAVCEDFPADTLDEFVAYAKAHPNMVSYSHIAHLSIHRVEFSALAEAKAIQLKLNSDFHGSMPAINAIKAGEVDAVITTTPHWLPLLEAGQVKLLAVANSERHPDFPELPTFAEEGVSAVPHGSWDGAFVPAGTPSAVVEKLYEAFVAVAQDPEVIAGVKAQGMYINISESPEAFGEFVAAESARLKAATSGYNIYQ